MSDEEQDDSLQRIGDLLEERNRRLHITPADHQDPRITHLLNMGGNRPYNRGGGFRHPLQQLPPLPPAALPIAIAAATTTVAATTAVQREEEATQFSRFQDAFSDERKQSERSSSATGPVFPRRGGIRVRMSDYPRAVAAAAAQSAASMNDDTERQFEARRRADRLEWMNSYRQQQQQQNEEEEDNEDQPPRRFNLR